MSPPLKRISGIVACSAIAVLGLPAAAQAGTVTVSGGTLVFQAGLNEGNTVRVTQLDGDTVRISDSIAFEPDPEGCEVNGNGNSAVCDGVTSLDVELADANDTFATVATEESVPFVLPIVANGGGGDDGVSGGDGDDQLSGDARPGSEDTGFGEDVVDGQGGDDVVYEGTFSNGADQLQGGAGGDTIEYGFRSNPVFVSLNDAADDGERALIESNRRSGVQNEGDDVRGFTTILTGSGADTVTGDGEPQVIDPGDGADTADGEGGDDVIRAADSSGTTEPCESFMCLPASRIEPDSGSSGDTYVGGEGTDLVTYAGRRDDLDLSLDEVRNDGSAGEQDSLDGSVENLTGGSGDDVITGNDQDNVLEGADGGDEVSGEGANDTLPAADDPRRTTGGPIIIFPCPPFCFRAAETEGDGPSSDDYDGGPGRDTVTYAGRRGKLELTLDGEANDGLIEGEDSEQDLIERSVENATGGSGDDDITGDEQKNRLDGGPGSDEISSGAEDDELIGGPGADLLDGEGGVDVYDAGAGPDDVRSQDGVIERSVDCGAGTDDAVADTTDVLVNCERRDGPAGTPGDPGAPGDPGEPGTPGTPGTPGSPGAPGDPGDPGAPGAPGAPGEPGADGSDGTNGAGGANGGAGAPGANGAPGPSGPAGPAGPAGPSGPSGTSGQDGGSGGVLGTTVRVIAANLTAAVNPRADTQAPFTFTTSGRLQLPAGVTPAQGCSGGTVTVQVKTLKRTISTRRVPLTRDCSYSSSVTFKNRGRFARLNQLRVLVRFDGNLSVLPFRAKALTVGVSKK